MMTKEFEDTEKQGNISKKLTKDSTDKTDATGIKRLRHDVEPFGESLHVFQWNNGEMFIGSVVTWYTDIQDNPDMKYLNFASDRYDLDAISESFVIPDHADFCQRLSKAFEEYVHNQ
jgi:hypothetical protein